MVFLVFLLASVQYICFAQNNPDLIINLPGITWNLNYSQYSGYLNLSNEHNLHYWFVESQNNPSTDPLVLWLNGGPGCSSLDGLFYELGPFHVYDNASLWENPWSWNRIANIIFLESPICVGFSYSNDGSCSADDNSTADDNYHAILEFYKKFPSFVKNDFFVTGESYGGVYVPSLTLRILTGNANNEGTHIPLKGFAVGNGFLDHTLNAESTIWYAYYHGLISETIWDDLQTDCCVDPYTRQNCYFFVPYNDNPICAEKVGRTLETIYNGQLNHYNIYGECFHNDGNMDNNIPQNELYSNKKLLHSLKMIYGQTDHYNIIKETGVPCVDTHGLDNYLNNMTVRAAIHVKQSVSNYNWSICSNTLDYKSLSVYYNMSSVFKAIFSMDSSVWSTVYNGDTDMSCDFLGDEWFVNDLGYPMINNYREWYINNDNGQQVGGWTYDFNRISFVTVRGSGHMVPQYAPQSAYTMFEYFLNHKQL